MQLWIVPKDTLHSLCILYQRPQNKHRMHIFLQGTHCMMYRFLHWTPHNPIYIELMQHTEGIVDIRNWGTTV